MAFLLYLDDDSESRALHRALLARSFDVVRATDVGMRGRPDEEHLAFAAAHDRVVVTANRVDFLRLHAQWSGNGRDHAGIIVVHQQQQSVGEILARLLRVLAARSAADMRNWWSF